jgi:adenylate cyclase
MNYQTDYDRIAEVARWLIGEARLSLAPLEPIDRFCHQLVELGLPLWRLSAGQRLANPLASAWGVIWTRDGSDTHEYVVPGPHSRTGVYYGSPFQHLTSGARASAAGSWT